MSSPFSSAFPQGLGTWTLQNTINGNFQNIIVIGGTNIPEVGYGEGGYGEDGYDTPTINISSSAAPIWTIETNK